MEIIGLIAVIGAGLFAIGFVFSMGWLVGRLQGDSEVIAEQERFLEYLNEQRDISIRHHSWASVEAAQAEFNSDFFEELWMANDSRLTIG